MGHSIPKQNPLRALQRFGQSLWLDDLQRGLFASGKFGRLMAEDGLRGVTSNPSIFEKAITGGSEYATAVRDFDLRTMTPSDVYEALAIHDIRSAADWLRPVYDATQRADGYASLEVSPYLAHDADATIKEARRLWDAVNRENVMIKVPASKEGVTAIRQLTSEGINVNITLLFGIERYEEVAGAYMDGLSAFIAHGGDPARVASVASIFVSRIDTMLDQLITTRISAMSDPHARAELTDLLGQVAIANAKLAYQRYLRFCRSAEWEALAMKGARPQRLLWASTSAKNPNYRDVRYVEELIGNETITTLTLATMAAFREHGRPTASVDKHIDLAHGVVETLEQHGISLAAATDTLLEEGIVQFSGALDRLLAAVDQIEISM